MKIQCLKDSAECMAIREEMSPRKIESDGAVIRNGQREDLDVLMELNTRQFGDDSVFLIPQRKILTQPPA